MGNRMNWAGVLTVALAGTAWAKIDLVTLPERDATQLTIYNSADLTLVRETRTLTLKKGLNRLEFGWTNTLIDPTSVQMTAPKHTAQVRLLEVSYPPNVQGSAVWTIDSKVEGAVPVEITFFTSGLSWRAFYMGTLSEDESRLRIEGYVRVENRSGIDYADATTRVLVGKIHTVDEITDLARRTAPYGVPDGDSLPMTQAPAHAKGWAYREMAKAMDAAEEARGGAGLGRPKKIVKEGLSEYFLYTIEGTETIENGWGKRLPSFQSDGIPVRHLYRYDEARFGNACRRFLFFKNDKAHKLGTEPLPDGQVKVYRELKDTHLSSVAEVSAKYIPVDEEAEFDLGNAPDVKVTPTLKEERTDHHTFKGANGAISGWDRIQTWELKVENGRTLPVTVEIERMIPKTPWEIANAKENPGSFEKIDVSRVKYRLDLPPRSVQTIVYTVTTFEGDRAGEKK